MKKSMNDETERRVLAEGKYVRLVARGRWEWAERTNTSMAVVIAAVTSDRSIGADRGISPPAGRPRGRIARRPGGRRAGHGRRRFDRSRQARTAGRSRLRFTALETSYRRPQFARPDQRTLYHVSCPGCKESKPRRRRRVGRHSRPPGSLGSGRNMASRTAQARIARRSQGLYGLVFRRKGIC